MCAEVFMAYLESDAEFFSSLLSSCAISPAEVESSGCQDNHVSFYDGASGCLPLDVVHRSVD